MKKKLRKTLILVAVLLGILGLVLWIGWAMLNSPEEVSTSEFVELIEEGQLTKVLIREDHIFGERRQGGGLVHTTASETMPLIIKALNEEPEPGESAIPFDEEEPARSGAWISTIVTFMMLGLFIFIGVVIYLGYRRASKGGGMLGSGGVTKHKAVRMDGKTKKTFADVGGIEEVQDEVKEVVAFLKNPQRFAKLGGRMPKGVMLKGPPGVGKTLLAQAVAGESDVPFFSVSGSEFDEMFVGVGSARIRDLAKDAKENAPCIVFVDEIESLGRKRGVSFSGGESEKQNTLNQFLQFIDGIDSSDGIVFMGSTNQPESLDSALMRPGRFDRKIHVPLPDINGRLKILKIHVHNNKVPLADDVQLEGIARLTPGMSGADLENLVNEAALAAGQRELDIVDASCFSEASDKVRMGLARKSMVMTEEEKAIICLHELGHATIGHLSPHSDPVQKVTCIPRGEALGVTLSAPERDRYLPYQEWLLLQIEKALGGRVAEEVIVGRITTGAVSDLAQVRELAWSMVTRHGMSDLSQMAYGRHGQGYLGQDAYEAAFSQDTARRIDAEVEEIVNGCYERVKAIITEHQEIILNAARELAERETLTEADLVRLLPARPSRPKPFSL